MAPKTIEIFRPGTHTSMRGDVLTFGESDLQATADAYDPALHEAPLVVGHPKHDAPAYGWAQSLAVEDGTLVAVPSQIDPAFAEAVEAGRYKKISAAFYPPDARNNPAPGVYYLRHIGFLGAQPPAVRGLKSAEFADGGDDLVTVEFAMADDAPTKRRVAWALRAIANIFTRLRDQEIADSGDAEAGDKMASRWQIDDITDAAARLEDEADDADPRFSAPHEETTVTTKPRRPRDAGEGGQIDDADLRRREQDLAAREAAFAEREARAEAEAFVDEQIAAGKLLPAQKDMLVGFMASLDDEDEAIEFAEGKKTVKRTPRDAFKTFVEGLPKQVEFGEVAGEDDEEPLDQTDAQAIANQAVAFQESQRQAGVEISMSQAVAHVTRKSKEAGR